MPRVAQIGTFTLILVVNSRSVSHQQRPITNSIRCLALFFIKKYKNHPPVLQIWLPWTFPQYEKIAGEKEILFKRGGDCGKEWLFCRVGQILLFGRDQRTGAALGKVYKSKRRLRRKMKMVCS